MSQLSSPPASSATGYLAALRARWLVVVLVAAVCVAVTAVLTLRGPSSYSASADVLVTPISSADEDFVGVQVLRDSVVAPSANVLTVARLVKTPGTAAIVAGRPGFDSSSQALLSRVSVSPLSQTSIVVIGATGSTPRAAASLANAFASATIARRTTEFQQSLVPAVTRLRSQIAALAKTTTGTAERAALEARLAVLQPLVGASDPTLAVLNPADPPASASGPSPVFVLPAALVGGILLGILAALGCELVDRRVRREEELGFAADQPALVRVPAAAERSRAVAATAFRDLRSRLLDDESAERPRSVLVTSASDGDGKTAVAVNLAGALAAAGKRVAILDGDFRSPSIAETFGVDAPTNGFDDIFSGPTPRTLVRPPGVRGKLFLALPTIRNGSQLARLDTKAVRSALAKLEKQVDVVIVDSSSAVGSSDALLLAKATDATVIAVRLGHSKRADVEHLERLLSEHDVHADAVVVFAAVRPRHLRDWSLGALRALRNAGGSPTDSRRAARSRRDGAEPRLLDDLAPAAQAAEATAARSQ